MRSIFALVNAETRGFSRRACGGALDESAAAQGALGPDFRYCLRDEMIGDYAIAGCIPFGRQANARMGLADAASRLQHPAVEFSGRQSPPVIDLRRLGALDNLRVGEKGAGLRRRLDAGVELVERARNLAVENRLDRPQRLPRRVVEGEKTQPLL